MSCSVRAAVSLMVVCAQTVTQNTVRERPLLGEVRRAIEGRIQGIRGLYVEYSVTSDRQPIAPRGARVDKVIAIQTPSRLIAKLRHAIDGVQYDDPYAQYFSLDGRDTIIVFPFDRTYIRGKHEIGDAAPGTSGNDQYLVATGLWPLRDVAPPKLVDQDVALSEIVANDSYGVVRYEAATDHTPALALLELPGADTLWLDPSRGYTVVRRQLFVKVSKLRIDYAMDEQIEVQRGVWLPKRIVVVQSDESNGSTVAAVRDEIDVHILRINDDVAPLMVQLQIPDGAVELDGSNPLGATVSVRSGGGQLLNDMVAWLEGKHRNQKGRRLALARGVVLYFIASAVAGFGMYFMRKKLRRKGSGA